MVGIVAGVSVAVVAGLGATAADFPKGLVLHLNFDQAGPGGVVADKSGLNNNGRAFGVKWVEKGKQGGACELAGANSFVQVVSTPTLNVSHATFGAWFKTGKEDPVWRRILDKGNYYLSIAGDSKDGQAKGKLCVAVGNSFCLSDSAVTDGAWHHAAATCDGKSLKLYLDGQLQKQTVPVRGSIVPSANELTIGMRKTAFDGVVDEVMIFNRALTAEEIKTAMEGAGGAAARPAGKTFTKEQVARRLKELKDLLDKGLITQSFYDRKVEECKVTE
jgi:hypothetical protein